MYTLRTAGAFNYTGQSPLSTIATDLKVSRFVLVKDAEERTTITAH